jgi:DNA topoisomerase-3
MYQRIYICEKPDQGKNLAKALGWNGGLKGSHIINGKNAITWGFGHLISQAKPERYISKDESAWNLSVLPVIPKTWIMEAPDPSKVKVDYKKSEEGKLRQLNVIGDLIKNTNEIIIATDFDREGEAIAWELLEFFGYKGAVKRMKFSSLDKKSLLISHDNMLEGSETYPSYLACLGRMRADWLMGMNITAALTTSNSKFLMRGDVLSAGRVQSPIVYLVVKRQLEIQNFKALSYFEIFGDFIDSNNSDFKGKLILRKDLLDEEGRLTDEKTARELKNKLSGKEAIVDKYDVTPKEQTPPLGYTLDDLQSDGINKFSYSAQQVLDLAQKLYETHKIASYPRSDCGYIAWEQFNDAKGIIASIKKNINTREFDDIIKDTDLTLKSPMWNTKEVAKHSHHAIIPIDNNYDISKLSKDEKNIYDLICRKYLMQFLGNYQYNSTNILIKVENEKFETKGVTPTFDGWKRAQGSFGDKDKDELPTLKEGSIVNVKNITLENKKTKPPAYYTEATLLKDMVNVQKFIENEKLKKIIKKGGIGTNATRSAHLENMFNKKYIVKKGKKLEATDKAMALDEILPNELRLPETTAYWEEALDAISKGTLTLEKFMTQQHNVLNKMIQKIKNGECMLKKPVSGGKGKIYTCPKCSSMVARINSKKDKKKFFWICSDKEKCNTLFLDDNGKLGSAIETIKQPEGEHPCPTCSNKMLLRKNRNNNSMFWVCSDKSCKTFCKDDNGKIGEKSVPAKKQTSNYNCTKCDSGKLILRKGVKGDFWGCNSFPKCKNIVNDANGKPEGFE